MHVGDGFGAVHRKHASLYDVPLRLPHTAGRLVLAEVEVLKRLTTDSERPYAVVLGGAKVSDKLPVIDNLLQVVDQLLAGGGMAYTFLAAQGHEVGGSLLAPQLPWPRLWAAASRAATGSGWKPMPSRTIGVGPRVIPAPWTAREPQMLRTAVTRELR